MARVMYEYTIPESLRASNGTTLPSKVALKQLTTDQELTASKLGRYDVLKTQYEAVKMAIAELDGKAADQTNGDVDQFWESAGPKLRSLMLQAYNSMSSASAEEEASFLKSAVVKV